MRLGIFSVAGSALHFGARRLETTMRLAWLPVVLLLVLEMAMVFSIVSVAAGRLISFSDVRTYIEAKTALSQYWGLAWAANPKLLATLVSANLVLQTVIVSFFMAPLIRFAGLDERPARGAFRFLFGPDQIRYILAALLSFVFLALLVLAPIGATAFYVFKYIVEALRQTSVLFPDASSLHTIEVVTAGQTIAEQGRLWVYQLGIPVAAAAPFALLTWFMLMLHFRPREGATAWGVLRLALGSLIAVGATVGLLWLGLVGATKIPLDSPMSYYSAILALALFIVYFVNLRLLPYQGVAVCRKSLAPAPAFGVTRGWNLIRLFAIVVILWVIIYFVQIFINRVAFPAVYFTISAVYQATAAATKLANGGEAAAWVTPVFIWLWNGFKILLNIFWAFFSYGVTAGLLGRLFRESEGVEP